MVKMNKSQNDEVLCPVCSSSDVIRISTLAVDGVPAIMLHEDVGDVYQCQNPECLSYFLKVNDKFESITKLELLRRQKDITDLLAAEADVSRARLVPSVVEVELAKAEAGRLFSGVLYHLTSATIHHRAYTVEEIIEACKTIGFNPLDVDNRRIGFVLNWLREHKEE